MEMVYSHCLLLWTLVILERIKMYWLWIEWFHAQFNIDCFSPKSPIWKPDARTCSLKYGMKQALKRLVVVSSRRWNSLTKRISGLLNVSCIVCCRILTNNKSALVNFGQAWSSLRWIIPVWFSVPHPHICNVHHLTNRLISEYWYRRYLYL